MLPEATQYWSMLLMCFLERIAKWKTLWWTKNGFLFGGKIRKIEWIDFKIIHE